MSTMPRDVAGGPVRSPARSLAGLSPFVGGSLLLLLVALGVAAGVTGRPGAGTQGFAAQWAPAALFACAAALPLSVRSVDLSLLGTAAVSGLVFGQLGGVVGLLAGVVVAAVVGVGNGVLAGLLRLHPAVTTFATGSAMVGVVVLGTSARGRPVTDPLPPATGLVVLVLVFLGAVALDAMSVAGVRVEVPELLSRATMHLAAAVLAGLAGVVNASTYRYITPATVSSDVLVFAFAAAVLGGTAAFGGWRSLLGAVFAAGFLAAAARVLALLGVTSAVSLLVGVLVLLVALGADRVRGHLTRTAPPG